MVNNLLNMVELGAIPANSSATIGTANTEASCHLTREGTSETWPVSDGAVQAWGGYGAPGMAATNGSTY